MIVSVPPDVSSELKNEFWNWVERRLILPIKEEYPELYESIVRSQMDYFDHVKNMEIDDEPK